MVPATFRWRLVSTYAAKTTPTSETSKLLWVRLNNFFLICCIIYERKHKQLTVKGSNKTTFQISVIFPRMLLSFFHSITHSMYTAILPQLSVACFRMSSTTRTTHHWRSLMTSHLSFSRRTSAGRTTLTTLLALHLLVSMLMLGSKLPSAVGELCDPVNLNYFPQFSIWVLQ